jgi:hypothetical protein
MGRAGAADQGGVVVVKKLALVTLCVAALGSSAWAQDAKAVIASAKKALGDPKSITYSGSARTWRSSSAAPTRRR